MENRKLGSFVIKMLGVYAIIQSLPLTSQIVTLFALSFSEQEFYSILLAFSSCIPFVLSLLVGIILIIRSKEISNFILRQESDLSTENMPGGRDFQAICFSAVAVLIFLQSIPRLGMLAINLWNQKRLYSSGHMMDDRIYRQLWQNGIPAVIQCLLAVVLFFGSRGLANLWHRIQVARYKRIDESNK